MQGALPVRPLNRDIPTLLPGPGRATANRGGPRLADLSAPPKPPGAPSPRVWGSGLGNRVWGSGGLREVWEFRGLRC